jgi:hypothetical protein
MGRARRELFTQIHGDGSEERYGIGRGSDLSRIFGYFLRTRKG